MLELLAIFGLVIVGVAVFAVLGLVAGLFKIGFKLLLLPLTLAWGLLKVVLFCGLIVCALVLAPAILACLLVALPLLGVACLVGCGWAVVAA